MLLGSFASTSAWTFAHIISMDFRPILRSEGAGWCKAWPGNAGPCAVVGRLVSSRFLASMKQSASFTMIIMIIYLYIYIYFFFKKVYLFLLILLLYLMALITADAASAWNVAMFAWGVCVVEIGCKDPFCLLVLWWLTWAKWLEIWTCTVWGCLHMI